MVTSRPYGVPTGGWKPYSGTEAGSAGAPEPGREDENVEESRADREDCPLATIMCPQLTVRLAGLGERLVGAASPAREVSGTPPAHPVKEEKGSR